MLRSLRGDGGPKVANAVAAVLWCVAIEDFGPASIWKEGCITPKQVAVVIRSIREGSNNENQFGGLPANKCYNAVDIVSVDHSEIMSTSGGVSEPEAIS